MLALPAQEEGEEGEGAGGHEQWPYRLAAAEGEDVWDVYALGDTEVDVEVVVLVDLAGLALFFRRQRRRENVSACRRGGMFLGFYASLATLTVQLIDEAPGLRKPRWISRPVSRSPSPAPGRR